MINRRDFLALAAAWPVVDGLMQNTSAAAQGAAKPVTLHDAFNSQQAYNYTVQVAGFGERWPGSPGHQKTRDLINQVLKKNGATIELGRGTQVRRQG